MLLTQFLICKKFHLSFNKLQNFHKKWFLVFLIIYIATIGIVILFQPFSDRNFLMMLNTISQISKFLHYIIFLFWCKTIKIEFVGYHRNSPSERQVKTAIGKSITPTRISKVHLQEIMLTMLVYQKFYT